MPGKSLYVYGIGGAGRDFAFSLSLGAEWNVVGFLDDAHVGETINGLPVVGGAEWLAGNNVSVALLMASDTRRREDLAGRMTHVEFPSIVSPHSWVSDTTELGEGALIAYPCSFVTSNSRIGRFVFCGYSTGIGHDVEIGDFTTIFSHVDISGGVKIGRHCVIGSGARVLPGVTIGDEVTVGLGAVVVSDIPDGATVKGCPAK